jgi:Asp-tRNA(Asn)/Glu-tRNA(Gln) amidotransferase C subunit
VSKPHEAVDIDILLSKPTWSVRSLLPDSQTTSTPEVTPKQLHHLLRLSALPQPSSPEEEIKMLQTLSSQLHFVREIQSIDTKDVEPLRSIRDESAEAQNEDEIRLEDLRGALAKEETKGRTRKIRRRTDVKVDANDVENWDVLGQAERKVGNFFVVDSRKE